MAIPALVVGTGFGCRIHVPALRAAGFEAAGLVGTNAERLARKAAEAGVRAFFNSSPVITLDRMFLRPADCT